MKGSIMPLKTTIAHTGWVAVSVLMSFASSPLMFVSSISSTCHPVNSAMILLQGLMLAGQQLVSSFSSTTRTSSSITSSDHHKKLPPPSRQTFPVGNQGLTPSLHCPGSTLMTLYINPRTQTGFQSSWWDTHAPDIWEFHCQITLKIVCYQPYWKASVWMLLSTICLFIHLLINQLIN